MNVDREDFAMRAPCPQCACTRGCIVDRNGQDTVRCKACNKHCYNAPRTETGRAVRTISTTHAGVKPSLRARIFDRDGMCCVICRATDSRFHVGHLISVEAGLLYGLSDAEINDEDNLAVMCEECNLGYGNRPIPLRTALAIVRARISWRQRCERS